MDGDFRIGHWLVEPSLNTISSNGASRHIEPKVMAVLMCLVRSQNAVVSKQQLIEEVWKDTFVTDDVLTRSISELRDTFGDDARNPVIIQTIPKQGYRLLLKVEPRVHEHLQPGSTSQFGARRWVTAAAFLLAVLIAGLASFRRRMRDCPPF